MEPVSEQVEISQVSGGGAPVMVYAADAVVTMVPEATLQAVAEELANDEIGLVVIGSAAPVDFTIVGTRSGLPPQAAALA